jgi:hypothetical protein
MKPFVTSSLATAIAFAPLLMTESAGVVLAQGSGNPQMPSSQTNVLEKQRDSAEGRNTQNTSSVQAKRKPNAAATAPDTSYSTITNTPPGTAGTAPGTSTTITPPRSTGAQRGLSVQDPTGKTNMPESMRIQQNTVRALPPRRELITKGGSSNPPSPVNSSIEGNRLDSSAPSLQRLQIDDLSARQAQQPNSPVEPTPATPATRGTGSSAGSSSGTSGSAVSRAPAAGTISGPSTTSRASSGASAGASSHSSAGSSSSGGGH